MNRLIPTAILVLTVFGIAALAAPPLHALDPKPCVTFTATGSSGTKTVGEKCKEGATDVEVFFTQPTMTTNCFIQSTGTVAPPVNSCPATANDVEVSWAGTPPTINNPCVWTMGGKPIAPAAPCVVPAGSTGFTFADLISTSIGLNSNTISFIVWSGPFGMIRVDVPGGHEANGVDFFFK